MQVYSCDKKNDGHFFMLVSLKSQGANLQVKIWYECVIVYVAICYLLQGPYRNTMLTYSICIHMCRPQLSFLPELNFSKLYKAPTQCHFYIKSLIGNKTANLYCLHDFTLSRLILS